MASAWRPSQVLREANTGCFISYGLVEGMRFNPMIATREGHMGHTLVLEPGFDVLHQCLPKPSPTPGINDQTRHATVPGVELQGMTQVRADQSNHVARRFGHERSVVGAR
jgi:hypothetical protein